VFLLHERLAAYGLACTRPEISAVTGKGDEPSRVWRHDGLLAAATSPTGHAGSSTAG